MFELAGYETLELIGDGGFGEVWLANQISTGRNVAVKVAHAPILDTTLQIRFEREYKALGRLSGHPHIVDIVTADTLPDGRAYLVLEFVSGGTLWDRAQRERLAENDLIKVGLELADALKAAHMAGVLHRDIKPENVMLRKNGEAVVSDFGLAQLKDGATTSPNGVIASVAYAAPEILQGEAASAASDIYGIGVCLLTAAMRGVPFVEADDKSIEAVIERVLSDAPPDLTSFGYSEQLSALVNDLMAKETGKRPATAVDATRRLSSLRDKEPESLSDEFSGDPASAVGRQVRGSGQSEANNSTRPPSDAAPNQPAESTSEESPRDDDIDQLIMELTTTAERREAAEANGKRAFALREEALLEVDEPNDSGAKGDNNEDGTAAQSATSQSATAEGSVTESTAATTPVASTTQANQTPPDPPANDDLGISQLEPNLASGNQLDTSESAFGRTSEDTNVSDDLNLRPLQPPDVQGNTFDETEAAAASSSTKKMPAFSLTKPDSQAPDPQSIPPSLSPERSPEPQARPSRVVPASSSTNFSQPQSPIEAAQPQSPTALEPNPAAQANPPREQQAERSSQTNYAAEHHDKDATTVWPLIVGAVLVATLAVTVGFLIRSGALSTSDSQGAQRATVDAGPVTLPLSLDTAEFDDGTIEATTPSLGPTAPIFCNNDLAANGLSGWKGSQFFVPDDRGSVEQLAANFESAAAARTYAENIDDSLNCETWNRTLQGDDFAVTSNRINPLRQFGEKTSQFESELATPDSDVTLRQTYVVVQDNRVLVVSLRAKTEADVEELTAVATSAATAFVEQ